jgi:chemotaxis protein methyltransferase CheR
MRAMSALEKVELELFLEAVHRHHGIDFRNYARSSLRRRVWNMIRAEGLSTISGLQERVLHDPGSVERLLCHLSVNVTAMFRDPSMYRAFREQVMPALRVHPFVRIWHAGCASGEEAYSLAILLHEEGLYERCRIYATDMSAEAVAAARAGRYPLDLIRDFTANYVKAGGKEPFSSYYSAGPDKMAELAPWLGRNLVFAQHNLVSDRSFNEFNVIFCRNVLIYFEPELQAKVHGLLRESLARFGVLVLGRRETLDRTPYQAHYEPLHEAERIYRRVG